MPSTNPRRSRDVSADVRWFAGHPAALGRSASPTTVTTRSRSGPMGGVVPTEASSNLVRGRIGAAIRTVRGSCVLTWRDDRGAGWRRAGIRTDREVTGQDHPDEASDDDAAELTSVLRADIVQPPETWSATSVSTGEKSCAGLCSAGRETWPECWGTARRGRGRPPSRGATPTSSSSTSLSFLDTPQRARGGRRRRRRRTQRRRRGLRASVAEQSAAVIGSARDRHRSRRRVSAGRRTSPVAAPPRVVMFDGIGPRT